MVLSLFPLDTFVDSPVYTMQVVGKPDEVLLFHKEGQEICDRIEGRKIVIHSLERFDFYKQVGQCFAIISTKEDRPISRTLGYCLT
jgi:L-fucose mutarotase